MPVEQPIFQPIASDDGRFKLLEEKIISLKELEDEKIRALKELITKHSEGIALNLTKSEETLKDKLEKVNEFRDQQKDMIATLARKHDTDVSIDALSKRFEENIKTVTARYETNAAFLNEKIADLVTWKNSTQGSLKVIMTIGGVLVTGLIGLAIALLR